MDGGVGEKKQLKVNNLVCRNPYSNGWWCWRLHENLSESFPVVILILMDGGVGERLNKKNDEKFSKVVILILMDGGVGDSKNSNMDLIFSVVILILMDGGVGVFNYENEQAKSNVVILILMDGGVGVNHSDVENELPKS